MGDENETDLLRDSTLREVWRHSPDHTIPFRQAALHLGASTTLDPRLVELMRLAVANNTRCPT